MNPIAKVREWGGKRVKSPWTSWAQKNLNIREINTYLNNNKNENKKNPPEFCACDKWNINEERKKWSFWQFIQTNKKKSQMNNNVGISIRQTNQIFIVTKVSFSPMQFRNAFKVLKIIAVFWRNLLRIFVDFFLHQSVAERKEKITKRRQKNSNQPCNDINTSHPIE